MRIVWLTAFLPGSCSSGSDIASQGIISGLRRLGHDVGVFGYASPTGSAPGPGEQAIGPAVGEASTTGVLRQLAWLMRSVLSREPVCSVKFKSAAFSKRLPELWESADLVIVDHVQLEWLVPDKHPFLAIAHNCESAVYAERALHASNPIRRWLLQREAGLLARAEKRVARRAQGVLTLVENDADYFRGLGGKSHVLELPGLDASGTQEPNAVRSADIGLLGLWTWGPNRKGLDWFIQKVIPLLPATMNIVVGGKGVDDLKGHPRLRIVGHVPDAIRFIRECGVHVIPSVAGGGVQVKTINAIALGVPVVATPYALRGLSDVPAYVISASEPAAFAAGCQQLAEQGRADADAGLAWQKARISRLDRALGQALEQMR